MAGAGAHGLPEIARGLAAMPAGRLLAAFAATLLAYAVLPGYDALALAYARHPLPARRTAFASLIAYALSQSVGFSALTGASVRYRFWSAWGLSPAEIARGVAFTTVTFWLGVLAVGGGVFAFAPDPSAVMGGVLPAAAARPLGAALLALVAAYLTWNLRLGRALTVRAPGGRAWTLEAPGPALAAAQVALSAADWSLAGLVLYLLLPPGARGALPFPYFLGAFLLAQVAGLVSHVPGGLGVFETVMLVLLRPAAAAPALLASLLAYRAMYYLLPFAAAVVTLAGHEIATRAAALARVARAAARAASLVPGAVPYALSLTTFAAGVLLLASGATPAEHERLLWLGRALPLGVIEASHFAGSVAGTVLVLLALGLRRRLDAAYHLAVAALGVGITASLLKGFDYEEAAVLAAVLAALLPARRHFYRRAALTGEPFTPGWLAAVLLALGGALCLGLVSYGHVAYSSDLWWHFALRADAPRFLRATVGSGGVAVAFALSRLLRPAPARPPRPGAGELARARCVIGAAVDAAANLALLGDKALLFDDAGRGFVMYGVAGRSWVAMGDPVGPPGAQAELAWRFRAEADRSGGWPVFYQVSAASLPLYIDLGLTLSKLGEEARVPLAGFSLDGAERRALRRAVRDVERAGATFEVVPAARVPALLPELRRVSDDWLAAKRTREKGFSLGRFDEAYLARFPAAVVRVRGRVVAFANVLAGGTGEELSVDLMRHAADAPRSVMDYLFAELMLWGSREGYAWFNLGMAPLAGFDSRALAPLWSRVGALLYRHGEHFYGFRGLRQYKEKFHPVWAPKYLASPGGLALPRILANVASLVSGGLVGVVRK
ncbi:MAG TPA: bifunctional lysylphosphatidylglycerol flippase/synthetase MprF [Gemmatimonadaceae bacterium]|nr:bifunctional lysylphosphatidylglycerol flippase/synthetase MprF [Gemmatimonadaceae bacterium]